MTPVFLLTDIALWLVLALALAYARAARRALHLRAPWQRVRQQPVAMAAAVILLLHVGIALLDSIHLMPAPDADKEGIREPLSLLDMALTPLRERTETSYSAPFALYGFDRESRLQEDGSLRREFPRLQHGGAHLADESGRALDILWRGALGAGGGALVAWLCAQGLWPGRRAAGLSLIATGLLAGALGTLALRYHVFGTDKVGTDVLYQSLKSIRTGLLIGTLTTLITLPFALALGIAAGY